MEITSQGSINVSEGGAYKLLDESECVTNQQMANGMLPNHTEESPPYSDRLEKGDSGDEALMDNTFPDDDISRLLPDCTPLSRPSKNKDSISEDRVLPPAVCTPPSPSIPLSLHPLPLSPSIRPVGSSSSSPPLQSTPCHRHLPHHNLHRPGANQKRLSSGAKSHASLKTDSAHHIKEVARDDCCAHCVLACLFCEVLSMCSVLGDCLACGGSGMVCCCDAAGCCCCCAEAVGGMACTEEACQAVLDCGIMEDCCGSSDCLEVCLECCSICFPS